MSPWRDLLRRSGSDDFTTSITSFRAEIDDPIGALDHVEIVLDHHEGMSAIHQALEQLQQHRHIVEMQSRGWLVEDKQIANTDIRRVLAIYRSCGLPIGSMFVVFRLSQMPYQLQPLRFATGKRVQRLAESQITKSYFFRAL